MPRLLLILGCILSLLKTSNALSIGKQRRFNRLDTRFNIHTLPIPLANRRLSSLVSPLHLAGDNRDGLTTSDESSLFHNHTDSSVPSSDSVSTNNDIISTTTGKSFQPFKFLKNMKSFNKESLSKLGMSALLSYGFVSNVSGVLAVSSAWFIFSKRTGLSPLAPGQRTPFLALYAGFTVALNIIRPARFAFAMAISPYFQRLRNFIQRKLGVSARVSALVMILCINVMGTCLLMGAGVGLASVLSGVPIWRVAQ